MIALPAFAKSWRSMPDEDWLKTALKNTPTIDGRYMLANAQEYPCKVRCLTLNGAEIIGSERGEIGDWVILYFDKIGIVVGSISQLTADGFTVGLKISSNRREAIKARIEWLAGESFAKVEQRDAPRVVPVETKTSVHLSSNRTYNGTIADLSLSGVALHSEAAGLVVLGEAVRVGKTKATVVRRFEGGFAAQFDVPFSPDRFVPDIRL